MQVTFAAAPSVMTRKASALSLLLLRGTDQGGDRGPGVGGPELQHDAAHAAEPCPDPAVGA